MKEADLQKKIIKYFLAKGGYAVNIIQASKAGVPDILACLDGLFYGIEVKMPGNVPAALQLANLKNIEIAGGIWIVAYSLEDVKKKVTKQRRLLKDV